jgi:CRP/FNR family transcriptional regulator, anaerobic regulatory protein
MQTTSPSQTKAGDTASTAPCSSAWREDLALLQNSVALTRKVLHAGDEVYRGGEGFTHLHVVNAGAFKTVTHTADGRGQVVGLHFKGAWLGFDGLATGRHTCDAVALDTGEVWALRYDTLMQACTQQPQLLRVMHTAMGLQITRGCDSLLSLGTLPADARVANFITDWAESLAARDLRTDQIRLHMSRAEMGNYLGMTLETVSRALRRLADAGVIRFDEKGRRDISIPSLQALRGFICCDAVPTALNRLAPAPAALNRPAPARAAAQSACRAF